MYISEVLHFYLQLLSTGFLAWKWHQRAVAGDDTRVKECKEKDCRCPDWELAPHFLSSLPFWPSCQKSWNKWKLDDFTCGVFFFLPCLFLFVFKFRERFDCDFLKEYFQPLNWCKSSPFLEFDLSNQPLNAVKVDRWSWMMNLYFSMSPCKKSFHEAEC